MAAAYALASQNNRLCTVDVQYQALQSFVATPGISGEGNLDGTERLLRVPASPWWLLIIGPAIACCGAYYISGKVTPEYRAESQIFVMNQSAAQINAANALNGANGGNGPLLGLNGLEVEEQLTNTYVRLIERRPVLEAVIATLALPLTVEELEEKIEAEASNTQLSCSSRDTARACCFDRQHYGAMFVADTSVS